MSLGADFETFCQNILLDNYDEMKTSAGEIAKKLNKKYYGLESDTSSHLYIVGSVGRGTAIKNSSDLDIIFDLPIETYNRFNAYESNGQSALLQELKTTLKERYTKTDISGDGQVVAVEFNKFTVEVVPGFKQSDKRFKYPDTHDGGSWKYTNPLIEQEECQNCNDKSNGIYFDMCHAIRSWKNTQGFKFGGLLIDSLVYDCFVENACYSDSNRDDYFDIFCAVLEFLGKQDKNRTYWHAVGSNQYVQNTGNGEFVKKANVALTKINNAVENNEDINDVLKELLGNEYPKTQSISEKAYSSFRSFRYTEEFIQDLFPLDIRYSLCIDCRVSQNGFRDNLLSFILKNHMLLRKNKQLEFFVKSTDCPKPYNIYWKVRNVGRAAEERDCIRGQIQKTNLDIHKEHTDFQGEHFVECYFVKNGVCVAKARIDVPIGTM